MDVYRGLQSPKVEGALGVHWTSSPEVATDFATGQGVGGYLSHRQFYKGKSSVIHGSITPHDIERDEDKLQNYELAMDVDEEEVPVKEGAPIQVHSITRYRGDNKSRKINFNPPRQMRA